MTVPYEALSELLSGDLSPADEAALRARIAAEPEVAAAWARMQALPLDLTALGDVPPPPRLDAEVLRRSAPSTGSPRWVAALAAGLLLGSLVVYGLAPPPPQVLALGSQLVEGRAVLSVGDLRIDVDGTALVSVEPTVDPLRGGMQEADAMNKQALIAALAGSLVTVAVYEGRASISGGTDDVELVAGKSAQFSASGDAPTRRVVRRVAAPENERPAEGPWADLAPEVAEHIEALEEKLARLEMQSELNRGRLAAHEGTAQPFPADLPPAFTPDGFEAALRETLGDDMPGDVLSVDCSEFPCLAILRSGTDADAWQEWVRAMGERLESGPLGEGDIGLGIYQHNSRDDEGGDVFLTGVAVTPDGREDDDLAARTEFRMSGNLRGAEDDIRDAAE